MIETVTIRGVTYQTDPSFDWQAEGAQVAQALARLDAAVAQGRRGPRRHERHQFNKLIAGVLSRLLGAPRWKFKGAIDPADEETIAGLVALLERAAPQRRD